MSSNLIIEYNFPKPLNETELKSYFEKMHNGDEDARQTIIEHNIRLVIDRVFKRFYNYNYEKEDLISIGILGLIHSIDSFDETKETKFSTYATRCIDNEIIYELKKKSQYVNDVSLNANWCDDDKNDDVTLENLLYDENNFIEEMEESELKYYLRNIILELPQREKEIIILYFYKNYPQYLIGKYCGLSRTMITKIIKDTLKKIALELMDQGLIDTYNITNTGLKNSSRNLLLKK